jgi:oligopeptide/dipeptide ABC transporter ATP-binding protein
MSEILSIRDLKIDLLSREGIVRAVRGINIDVARGEIHGIVGESGCGKTVTAKAILQLHEKKRTRLSGRILFNQDTEILKLDEKSLRKIRGGKIAMIFQDPSISINPLLTIGEQITEILLAHKKMSRKEARREAVTLLEKVGIQSAEKRIRQYPFSFSGGMLQRVAIATAIACGPDLLIADEPTTALDVTIQAQILELLKQLRKERNMSILIITHNLGVVAELCDRVSVMYAGEIVESGDVNQIFNQPAHPYTRALLESMPRSGQEERRLTTIPGSPPKLTERIDGCAFFPRCKCATIRCQTAERIPLTVSKGHTSLCSIVQQSLTLERR